MTEQTKREFIEFMMESDVLRFGNFVTKSGFLTENEYRHITQCENLEGEKSGGFCSCV